MSGSDADRFDDLMVVGGSDPDDSTTSSSSIEADSGHQLVSVLRWSVGHPVLQGPLCGERQLGGSTS